MRHGWWGYSNTGGWCWPGFVGVGIGRRSRFFEFGEVRLAILSLLSEGPKHGYQLMKEMTERSGGLYRASAGSVYPTLQQLEDEGLVETEQREGRRVYRLTEAGRKELERDPEAVRRIWERAESWEDWGQHMRPEVIAYWGPIGAVIKSTFKAATRAAGNVTMEDRIRAILQRACRDLDDLKR